jgi:AbiV family abortive infection protein
MTAPSFDPALLSEFARGAEKTFANAEQLYYEARMLASGGAPYRALFLHQISLEECAKVENIGWLATMLLLGLPVDEKKMRSSFTSHSRKNHTNAYALKATAEEQSAKQREDWRAASEAFKKHQADFHESSNRAKNASLYVDFVNGQFVSPSDLITEEMLAEIAERNESLLSFTAPSVRLLVNMNKSPEKYRILLLPLMSQMKSIAANYQNIGERMRALEKLLSKMIDAARESSD